MTGRWLRVTVFVLLGLASLWAYWALRGTFSLGNLAWAFGGAVLILAFHVPVLAAEFVLMHRTNRSDPSPRATLRELVSAWWTECRLGVQVFAWRQPFFEHRPKDLLQASQLASRGVVLVHGFMCNRGMWASWMQRLRERGVPHVAITLSPTFGSIDDYAATVGEAVQRMHKATGLAPVIVAHSMGGLATRAWLRSAGEQRHTLAHRIITLGTPHRGTLVGAYNPATNVTQMGLASAWLADLARSETTALRQRFICFYSHCDNVVFPASTATLPDADNRHVRATAHMQLIERHEVFDAVIAALQAPDLVLVDTPQVVRGLPALQRINTEPVLG
jgi:triacylglycerol lipase